MSDNTETNLRVNLKHRKLTNLVHIFAPKLRSKGVCNGFTSMWFQAVFTGTEAEQDFYERLDYISTLSENEMQPLNNDIDSIFLKKTKNKEANFSPEEKKKIDLRAFLENIATQQEPRIVSNHSQNNKKSLYSLTASKELENLLAQQKHSYLIVIAPDNFNLKNIKEKKLYINKKGNYFLLNKKNELCTGSFTKGTFLNQKVKAIFDNQDNLTSTSFSNYIINEIFKTTSDRGHTLKKGLAIQKIGVLVPNINELTAYFLELKKLLIEENKKTGLFLGSENHATGVYFNPISRKWHYLDINKLSGQHYYKEVDCQSLSELIFSSFYDDPKENTAFSILGICHPAPNSELLFEKISYITKKTLLSNLHDAIGRKNKRECNALFFACQDGHTKITELLLKLGADFSIKLKESSNATALYAACEHGHEKIVELLLKYGAHIQDNGPSTLLYIACQNGHTNIVKLLLQYENSINVNIQNNNDPTTPFHIACAKGHTEIIKLLLKHGVNINQTDSDGFTSLYIACAYRHTNVVALLLEQENIEINCKDQNGATPLHIACKEGYTAIVDLLLKKGADCNVQTKDTKTPLFFAQKYGHKKIAKLLKSLEENNQKKFFTTAFDALKIAPTVSIKSNSQVSASSSPKSHSLKNLRKIYN